MEASIDALGWASMPRGCKERGLGSSVAGADTSELGCRLALVAAAAGIGATFTDALSSLGDTVPPVA